MYESVYILFTAQILQSVSHGAEFSQVLELFRWDGRQQLEFKVRRLAFLPTNGQTIT